MNDTPTPAPYTEEERQQLLKELFSDYEPSGLSESDIDEMAVLLWQDGVLQPKLNFHDL